MARDPKNRVLFVSDGRPLEISVLSKKGFTHECITVRGIKGTGIRNQVASLLKIPRGIFESVRIIRRFRPDLVIGVGSYSAGPVVMGAWLSGIKIALQEQNILPGITNRILSPFADRIYVSFENSKLETRNLKKVRVTGNPIRKEIRNSKHEARDSDAPFTVLIIGGSQGARSVNLAIMEAITYIKDKDRFFFIHQTRVEDEKKVKDAYIKEGLSCTVRPFFDDMARQYQKADLLICRAGATTVAEITAMGKGAIFIPYPFAANNHQVLNAQTLTNAGAGEMILQKDLSARQLAERIEYYASDSQALETMASRAKHLGRPAAAEAVVDDCYKLVGGQ